MERTIREAVGPIRTVLRAGLALALIAVAVLTGTTTASAVGKKSVTVTFSATVEFVDRTGFLCSGIAPGDVITGTYTYSLSARDSNDLPTVGDYRYTKKPNGITLNLGDSTTGTDPRNADFLVEIVNDHSGSDNFLLRSYQNLPLSCGTPVEHISWQLDDPTMTALTSTDLPTGPVNLDDFQSFFGLQIEGPDGAYLIRAHVTAVS